MSTTNCGLRALEQMASLKNVSAFTLIHLAKDNGVNLYFCQVEQNELVSVARPAIFHQNNHFVFVEDGKPMPAGEYDGYVLTPKPLHEPLPYSLAKKVRGQKGGGKIVSAVITGVATIINPVLGAAVGAGFAAHQTTGGGGYFGDKTGEMKGQFWRIPVGAATAYLGGGGNLLGTSTTAGRALLAGSLAAASELPSAIKSGNWMAPVTAGIGQYIGSEFTQGAAAGLAGATGSIGDKIWAAGQGGLHGIGIGKGPTAAVTPAPGTTPAGYTGTFTVPGAGTATSAPGTVGPAGWLAGAPTMPGGAATTSGVVPGTTAAANALPGTSNVAASGWYPGAAADATSTGAASQASAATSWWDKTKSAFMPTKSGTGTSTSDIIKLGATALMVAPKLSQNPQANVSEAATYMGNEQFQALPEATRRQLEEYVNTPIEQLAVKFTAQNDQGLRLLDQQKQKAIDDLMIGYANYGQDPYTSSEAQQKLTEINRQYDQAKSEMQQQMQTQGMTEAIKFKQDMLVQSINQNNFDYRGFMDLAERMGIAQDAQDALNSMNYDVLTNVLGEVLSNTFGAKKTPAEVPAMG